MEKLVKECWFTVIAMALIGYFAHWSGYQLLLLATALPVLLKILTDNIPERRCYAVVMNDNMSIFYWLGDGWYQYDNVIKYYRYTKGEAIELLKALQEYELDDGTTNKSVKLFIHKKGTNNSNFNI